ncbi:CHAT domain-containing protein [Balneolales bacterium ANBcel1]|nr:CHAT domain-containing protein [Balneolales bacterium ANBcel1]
MSANKIIERVRHTTDLQSGHMFFDSFYAGIFNLLIKQLTEHNRHEEALFWMDEVKNLSSFAFFNNPALKSSILTESELTHDYALRNRIERLRSEMIHAEGQRRYELNNQLVEATSQQNMLRRKVLQHIDLEPFNFAKIRRQLRRSDIILYFSLFEDDLYASTITSGSFDIHHIPFSEQELERVDKLVESLSGDRIRLKELEWFRSKVIDVLNIDDRHSNYYVIPDGFLYHIPLEILPLNSVSGDYSYGEATYLIEHASVSYANSLKDLEAAFDHTPATAHSLDFLGFGISHFEGQESRLMTGRNLPPLPLAEREVTEISNRLDRLTNNVYHHSQTSTKNAFRNYSGKSRILHLASHSEVFETDPLYSPIYMSPERPESNPEGNAESGLIYAYELFGMDLSNEMVMLNSCESGSGNYIQGSGIVGFSRAFNYAGVKSLVMNLWTIRDQSAYELSVSFYANLNEGMEKSEAMRQAKIAYMNSANSNPSYWGSFVIYGSNDPVVKSFNFWLAGIALFAIGLLTLLLTWIRLPGIHSRH